MIICVSSIHSFIQLILNACTWFQALYWGHTAYEDRLNSGHHGVYRTAGQIVS